MSTSGTWMMGLLGWCYLRKVSLIGSNPGTDAGVLED